MEISGVSLDANMYAAAISFVAFIFSIFTFIRQQSLAHYQRENAKHIADQERMQHWRQELRAWGDLSIHTISEAKTLYLIDVNIMNQMERYKLKYDILTKISALIDQGRMFYKNDVSTDYGSGKPLAYRGHSPLILDQLKKVYKSVAFYSLENSASFEKMYHVIWEAQRVFVSDLQFELSQFDPEWQRNAGRYRK